jgi:hypothetical protein
LVTGAAVSAQVAKAQGHAALEQHQGHAEGDHGKEQVAEHLVRVEQAGDGPGEMPRISRGSIDGSFSRQDSHWAPTPSTRTAAMV